MNRRMFQSLASASSHYDNKLTPYEKVLRYVNDTFILSPLLMKNTGDQMSAGKFNIVTKIVVTD